MKTFIRLVLLTLVAAPLFASTTTIYYQKALEAYADGNYDAAIDDVNTVLANDPQHWKALEIEAYCFYQKGNTKECDQTCLESLKLHPHNPPLKAFTERIESGETLPVPKTKMKVSEELADLPAPPDMEKDQAENTNVAPASAPSNSSDLHKTKAAHPSVQTRPAFSIGPLVSIPLSSNTATQFTPGPGVEAALMFPANEHESLGIDLGFQSCPLNQAFVATESQILFGGPLPPTVSITGNFTYIPVMFMAKYYTDKLNSGFYLMSGVGFGVNSLSISASAANTVTLSTTEVDLLTAFGAGVDFGMGFCQVRLDLDFTSGTNDTYTLSNGTPAGTGSLTGDKVTIFFPIQAGLKL